MPRAKMRERFPHLLSAFTSRRLYANMVEALVSLPDIEKVSDRVIRVLGGNPGKFTLQGTNTYIVGRGPSRLLIDSGEGKPQWIASVKSVLSAENITIDKVLLTHWHPDHVGGISDLLSHLPDAKIYKNTPHDGWLPISEGQKFETEGATLRAFHCPGHTTDHMAFVIEEEDAMFTADNVLGHGTAVFEDLSAYMKSLDAMSKQFKGRAYPGHGPVIADGPGKIAEYITHRKQREQQVLSVLAEHGDEMGPMDIVKVIYKDYPESLWEPAARGIVQILDKLKQEGKVGQDGKPSL
ncbi:metallo-beta-lactamase superfamily [Pyrenophora seminiperda CCB06]|uniref:Metallo-beta-lactamase superfamily n=1 Tax=Pyrenophora seminiperda CCB06 TaxID=1302712 RepID=A0A3M7M769_9PLEO|nr:metallo-beta-lactamase superfamily [Pyrenophora seminiperda CCB06]